MRRVVKATAWASALAIAVFGLLHRVPELGEPLAIGTAGLTLTLLARKRTARGADGEKAPAEHRQRVPA